MKTEAEALAYIKENTFINEAGRFYKSGEHIDEAIVILDKMVKRQRKELKTVDRDLAEMEITIMISIIIVIASIGVSAYMLTTIDNPSKLVLLFAVVVTILLSYRAYSLYTDHYKIAIQERRRLRQSISDNSLIQVNF